MDFIINNWFLFIAGLAVGCFITEGIIVFIKSPKTEQRTILLEWLKEKVYLAEKELGGGTGQLKLSKVYGWFVKELPWLARIFTFKEFSDYVDEALKWLNNQLETNPSVKDKIKE